MGDRERFSKIVDDRVAGGWRIESRTDTIAVLVKGKPVSHLLHLVLSVFTLGLWIIVWVNVVAFGGERRSTIRLKENGKIMEDAQWPGPFKSWPHKPTEL